MVYACNTCNATRRDISQPLDPARDALGHHVQVVVDGTVQPLSELGGQLIERCRLNCPLLVDARRCLLSLIAVLQALDRPEATEVLRDLLAYSSDVPALPALRPLGGNDRLAGIANSCFERRRRGELPEVY